MHRDKLAVLLMQISPTLIVLKGWVAGESFVGLELAIPCRFRILDMVVPTFRSGV